MLEKEGKETSYEPFFRHEKLKILDSRDASDT